MDFVLSFANNTMQILSLKDRSRLSEDKQTNAGTIPIFASQMLIWNMLFCMCSVKKIHVSLKISFVYLLKKITAQWYHNVTTAKYITYSAAFTAL